MNTKRTTEELGSIDTGQPQNEWYRIYDLGQERAHGSPRTAAQHQAQGLGALRKWYDGAHAPAGGLLVFPTGGGKTFTAMRFIAEAPLSDDFKILWLAHTHHLLEQAADSLGRPTPPAGERREVGNIGEPRAKLRVRVVSGSPGHSRVADIATSDDVVLMTLQAAANAWKDERTPLRSFLGSANGRLFVVFDEAHHAPAPSYARLVQELRVAFPAMKLLGLTATPTYSDERRKGWLGKLFPQGKIHEADARKLTAQGILAKPVYEQARTHFTPDFDHRAFERWVESYGDIPEDVIEHLAQSQSRNQFIVDRYVADQKRYGKTIIFADRWSQCEYLSQKLQARGVRAAAVYSHVASQRGSAEERNRRDRTANSDAIAAFRKGEVDVLINVRMLTEGTDIPDAQTVFITRQTTSRILLTQMVGRALRGKKFGGTETANIVMFIDNWQDRIAWAEVDDVMGGHADEAMPEYGPRAPLTLVSIDLVRRLVREMQGGAGEAFVPMSSFLPVGWYRLAFRTAVPGPDGTPSDDSEDRRDLVMVYEHERADFAKFVVWIVHDDLEAFEDERVTLDAVRARIERWRTQFFAATSTHIGADIHRDLFHIARHVAQSGGDAPPFFAFEERQHHDLERVAGLYIERDLGPLNVAKSLKAEYDRADRFWHSLYPSFDQFQRQYGFEQDHVVRQRMGLGRGASLPTVAKPERIRAREPSDGVKEAVKSRDNYTCLSCGETHRRMLVIDHIAPAWVGGSNELGNLQTLCSTCNGHKEVKDVNFMVTSARSTAMPSTFEFIAFPKRDDVRDPEAWKRHVRRNLNFFYRARAVDTVDIGKRGETFYNWKVRLFPSNDHRWMNPYHKALCEQVIALKAEAGLQGPTSIRIERQA